MEFRVYLKTFMKIRFLHKSFFILNKLLSTKIILIISVLSISNIIFINN